MWRRGGRNALTRRGARQLVNAEFQKVHSKVRWNKVEEVRDMIARGCPVDLCDDVGNTPLCVACQNGHMDITRFLLGVGASRPRPAAPSQPPP